jgi:hypothetical protein
MSHRQEIEAILKQVELWPSEEKRELVDKLLRQQRASTAPTTSRPKESLSSLLGIANPTGRQYTDEEIDEMRFQALKEKYKL